MSNARRTLAQMTRRELLPPAIEYFGALGLMAFSVTVLGIAYASGVVYWASQPVTLAAQTLAVMASVGTGVLLQLREVKGPGHWLVAMGYVLALYTTFQAVGYALVYWADVENIAVSFLVSVGSAWWVVVLTVAQLAALAVGHHIRGVRRHRYQVFQIVYVSLVMLLFIPQSMAFYPFEDVPVFLGDTVGQWSWLQAIAPIFSYTWMAMLPVVPILLFWGVRKTAPANRRPLVIAAAASLMPMTVVLICEILWLAFTPAGMSETTSEIVLISAHGLGTGFSAVALGFALRHAHRRSAVSDKTVGFFLSAAASVLLLILAVTTSIILSLVLGGGAVFVVAVITAVVAIAFMSVRKRAVDAVLAHVDPYRSRARRLAAADDPIARTQPALAARDAIRASIRDPDAELLLLIDGEQWVDIGGTPADASTAVFVPGDEAPVAAVRSTAEPDAVLAVCSVLHELIDRAALAASLHAQAKRLVEERQRSATAAADERQRLERNLHDGVQGRLLALALQLRQAESEDPNARLVFGEAVDSLRSAIDELRTLATGSMPAHLTAGGLSVALGDFCRRMPMPVELDVTPARFRPEVEEVAYFVVSESLTNAVKHGRADAVQVTVQDGDGVLAIEVADDGSGGADPRAGSGLRGLGERVRAAGGQFLVSELQPHGTRVEVQLPCA